MKILVLSDSHRDYFSLEKAIKAAGEFDTVIFLGDGEEDFADATRNLAGKAALAVRGNCDECSSLPAVRAVGFDGHRLLLCHGHTMGVNYDLGTLAATARENNCEAALFGHTHRRCLENEGGTRLFNPGSVSSPRDGKPRSYGIATITPEGISFAHFSL